MSRASPHVDSFIHFWWLSIPAWQVAGNPAHTEVAQMTRGVLLCAHFGLANCSLSWLMRLPPSGSDYNGTQRRPLPSLHHHCCHCLNASAFALIVEVYVIPLAKRLYPNIMLLCCLVMAVVCFLKLEVGDRRASREVHRKDFWMPKNHRTFHSCTNAFSPWSTQMKCSSRVNCTLSRTAHHKLLDAKALLLITGIFAEDIH